MKGTCPNCGTGGSITVFIADVDARNATMAAAKLPSDCGLWTIKYIRLFAPKSRFLTPGRYVRLIQGCCDMILDGVDFDREHIKAPSQIWRQAMIEIVERQKIQRPIKNHHYLLRIVQSLLAKRHDFEQSERAVNRSCVSKPVHSFVDTQAVQTLPEIPVNVREIWLKKAYETLISDGFNQTFISLPLIGQKAKEMFLDAHHG